MPRRWRDEKCKEVTVLLETTALIEEKILLLLSVSCGEERRCWDIQDKRHCLSQSVLSWSIPPCLFLHQRHPKTRHSCRCPFFLLLLFALFFPLYHLLSTPCLPSGWRGTSPTPPSQWKERKEQASDVFCPAFSALVEGKSGPIRYSCTRAVWTKTSTDNADGQTL